MGLNFNRSSNTYNGGIGCAKILLWFFLFCFAVFLYSYVWIPAIIAIIIFAVKKDNNPNKKRNIIISAAIAVTSLFLFIGLNSTPDLTGIEAEWRSSEYDILDETQVKISAVPNDAEIKTLELSQNSIADLNYKDGKAIVTFKNEGEAQVFFTANGNIHSGTYTIKVIDKAAEAKKQAEMEAQKKAEEEAQIEAQKKAEEEARKAEEERLAAEAAAQQAAQEEAAAQQAAAQESQQFQGPMVWIPATGSRYHSNSSCSGMNNPQQVTVSEAESLGFTPCKKCY